MAREGGGHAAIRDILPEILNMHAHVHILQYRCNLDVIIYNKNTCTYCKSYQIKLFKL